MIYAILFLLCLLYAITFHLNRLRRRELIRANKGEALIKRLYSRINELETRCYRLRRQIGNKARPLYVVKGHYLVSLQVAEGDNKVTQLYELGRNGEIDFVEWLN